MSRGCARPHVGNKKCLRIALAGRALGGRRRFASMTRTKKTGRLCAEIFHGEVEAVIFHEVAEITFFHICQNLTRSLPLRLSPQACCGFCFALSQRPGRPCAEISHGEAEAAFFHEVARISRFL